LRNRDAHPAPLEPIQPPLNIGWKFHEAVLVVPRTPEMHLFQRRPHTTHRLEAIKEYCHGSALTVLAQ
jgi:hypothetical protein